MQSETTSNKQISTCVTPFYSNQGNNEDSSYDFQHRKGLNTSFIQPKSLTWTILVSDKRFAGPDKNNAENRSTQWRKTQMCDLHLKTKLLQPHQLQNSENRIIRAEPSRTSTGNRRKLDIFVESIPTSLLKKRSRMWWFQRNIRKLRIFC